MAQSLGRQVRLTLRSGTESLARRPVDVAPFVIPMNRDSCEAHLVVRMERAC